MIRRILNYRANRRIHRRIWEYLLWTPLLAGAAWLAFAGGEFSYQWDFSRAWSYVAAEDENGGVVAGLLLSGLAGSLRLLLFAGALSLVLGALLAALLLSPLRAPAVCYVETLRNLPPLVFMFIFFYFTAAGAFDFLADAVGDGFWARALFGDPKRAGDFVGGVVCLAMFEAAFFAEIMRAGVLSVGCGQRDAARALGLSRWRTFRLVVLPQAGRNIAAPLVGQMILLVKDSAILSVISVPELTFAAQEASVSSRRIFEVWLLAAGFYFLLCWPMMLLAQKLERRR